MGDYRRMRAPMWPGVGLSIGAGLGILGGGVVAGAPGMAIGAVLGAGLGLLLGAVIQSWGQEPDCDS